MAAVLVAAACVALPGCGGDDGQGRTRPGDTTDPPRAGGGPQPPVPGLALGLSEANPNLVWSAAERPTLPRPFGASRDLLSALRPRYFRLMVSWSKAQPSGSLPPDFERPEAGCLRAEPPCAQYAGVRDQLRAIASQQRAQPGSWEVLVVLLETPAWAARPAAGCEPRGDPRARAPADLAAYRRFVGALLAQARATGASLRHWSAWNEPNHPGFLNPQRARCDVRSPALAPGLYADLVRALKRALDEAPGDQQVVLGEVAGYDRPRRTAAAADEFVRALPPDVACLSDVWAQHAYVGQSGRAAGADYAGDADLRGSPELLGAVKEALDGQGCPLPKRLWITETGVGGPRAGRPRPTDPVSQVAACRDLHQALASWYLDPRVEVAFQYTFRDDNFFPVGLVDTALTRPYPVYDLIRAWAGARAPDDPPPPLPASCR